MTPPIKRLLVDDQRLFREALRIVLAQDASFALVIAFNSQARQSIPTLV